MNIYNKILGAFLIVVLFSTVALSQTKEEKSYDSLVAKKWLLTNYVFDQPGENFILLPEGNGYRNESINATVKYLIFPAKYSKVKEQFLQQKSSDTSIRLDVIFHTINGKEAFTIIKEEVSPDKTQFENFIGLTTIVEFEYITACVIGAYPKSYDSLLRKKFIESSLSIKEQ